MSASPATTGVAFPSPLRVILVPLSGGGEDASALAHAGVIAARFLAHVDCVHVPEEPPPITELAGTREQRGFVPPADGTRDRRGAAARQAFNAWRIENGWPVSGDPGAAGATVGYAEIDGEAATILTARAGAADLVILPRPAGLASLFVFDSLLTGSGRPILMVPPTPSSSPSMHGAIVAWNGSVQAARALGAGVHLIRALGGEATVLSVAERNRPAEASDAAGYLRWHGIAASEAEPGEGDVGAQLLALSRERNAGLIVSGAYSRSRLRQLLFGGVTGYLVEHADVPILFAG